MKIATLATFAVAGLSLAACSGGTPEEQPANETIVANVSEPESFSNVMIEEPAPAPTTNVIATDTPPTAELAPDEQTDDYAAATGMTSRVDRNASDEAQPAQ